MASSFGVWEVKFPSSRAVYDEDDEDDEDSSLLEDYSKSVSFYWAPHVEESPQTPSPRECRLLVLALGEVATTFLQAHFLTAGSEVVACITSRKDTDTNFEKLSFSSKSADVSVLHRLTTTDLNESAICQCRNPVPQEKAFHWTEKVRQRTSGNNESSN